ncbi:MAG: mechanosensitive ion channel family protein [Notoacmeibacter sp.]|nr:mechanosensitive ion channel family protein [Notoacmeibacter sp.]MCC0032131.1 mechanosensitive ion channel family protein [Brucellaceae bacterium]
MAGLERLKHVAARFLAACLLAAAFQLLPAPSVSAQDSPKAQEQSTIIVELTSKIEGYEKDIEAISENDVKLVEVRLAAEQAARDVLSASLTLQPRITDISTRLEQLGTPPAEGQPAEPETVTAERNRLLGEKAEINELLGKAENASIAANRLSDRINELRRELFTKTLTRRFDINYDLAGETLNDFSREQAQLYRYFQSWITFVTAHKLPSVLGATFLALLVAFVLLAGGRRSLSGFYRPDPHMAEPSYLSRLSVAFWSTLLPSMAVAVFMAVSYLLLDVFGVLRSGIDRILFVLAEVVGIVFFVNRLSRAVFAPGHPAWRLLHVADGPARVLYWLVTAMAAVTGLDFLLTTVNEVMMSPLSLTVAKGLIATVLVGLLILATALVRPFADGEGHLRGWPNLLKTVLAVTGIGIIAASLLGFVGFAQFLSQQVVVTGAIMVTMYLGFRSASSISEEGNFAKTMLGRKLAPSARIDETTLDQLGLASGLMVNLLVLMIGIPLILLQWGFQYGDIKTWAFRLATEIRIGSVSFSLVGVLTGILVFIVAYFATRWFQGWLDNSVLKRGRFDSGVRNSIRTAVGYLGIALAVLIGISVAGIDLSNLALVAGALSLGIGFGLQNIVSNFVSGLILLAERPFKVGDWIEAGGHMGLVKRISVRATEIETFQRQTIILPNSELINSAVGNRTHRNHLGRIDIAVGVSYDCDPAFVRDLLLEIARETKLVLRNPEPQVFFANFGASSLDFELRVHVADIFTTAVVQTELRLEIFRRLKDAGIEIPFPQQDVHIKSGTPEDVRRFADAMRPKSSGDEGAGSAQPGEAAGQDAPRRRKRRTGQPD